MYDMNDLWSKLTPSKRESEIVRWIELFRNNIDILINCADWERHDFNYKVDIWDGWNMIILYDNGNRFASCDLALINTPSELLSFIMEAIDTHFFDYFDPDIEEAAETLKANRIKENRTIRELCDAVEPEELV